MAASPTRPQLPFRTIFVAYALVILAVSVGIMLLLSRLIREQVMTQAQREAELVAQLLAVEFTRLVDKRGLSEQDLRQVHGHLNRMYQMRAQARGVAWVKVYAADGRILYSPDPTEVGQRNPEDLEAVQKALSGQRLVYLVATEDEPDLAQRGLPPYLVEVYVPLPRDSEPFRVFEVYVDVTPYLEQGRVVQWRIGGVLTLGAVLLFGLMVYITRRAYAIIVAQVQELAEAHAALQQLEAHKQGLVNMVVHDLKNLLGVVLGNAELLAAYEQGERAAWIQELLQAGRHMQSMMQDMLDIARLEDATFPLELRPVSLVEVVPDAIASFCRWAEEQGKACRVTLADDLRPVQADPAVLTRVLQNLLSNAVHHASSQVEVIVEATPEGARLVVADDGPGIPAEHLTRIFDPYYRVPGTRRRGAGLGLAFCKYAVQAMQGHIAVESVVGRGTRFVMMLPWA